MSERSATSIEMRLLFSLVALSVMCSTAAAAAQDAPREVTVDSAERLQELFAEPVESLHVRLAPGVYRLTPSEYTDPTCGNCQPDAINTPAETTVGLHIRGSNIRLIGPDEEEAILHTNAGYGVLIEDANGVLLERITITGGKRSTDGNATDGAVIVRRSGATLRNCTIRDNIGEEDIVRKTVSGVAGVVGREHSRFMIDRCRILRNSWDGVALYRDASVIIRNTVIDGMERSTGDTIGGGRGVGVGATWNARATIRDTLIRRYWKGLGAFVDANVNAERVIVEEIVTWGIALWGAGAGQPILHARNCVVFNTGACGVSLAAETEHHDPGELIGCAIVRTGQHEAYDSPDTYCQQCPIARARVPERFRVSGNMLFGNRRADCNAPDDDMTEQDFREQVGDLLASLSNRPELQDSSFLQAFDPNSRDASGE
jgi:hypothetical protein